MRRKSERVSKTVVEKKPEKSPKKTRGRTSRRTRKKSASTSPESSDNEQFETSFRSSQEDTEEETSSGTSRTRREKQKVVYTEADVDAPEADDVEAQPKVFTGRTRRSSKKQTAEEAEEQAKSEADDKSVEEAQSKGESGDQKHKEKEGKSSVWQVKSADCSSGEIKKLKLCIVRPQEVAEQSPKKHKKSRSSRSSAHRELAESEAGESSARDSSGERRKSRKSHRHASASDDSTSPDKGKGKHKSGESSEDGHRTQDSSEEVVAQAMQVDSEKPAELDARIENESAADAVVDAAPKPDPSGTVQEFKVQVQEEDKPTPIRAESPVVTEMASQSAASSPDTKDDSSQSIDPFDKLTMEEKPQKRRAEQSQEDVPSCDSTVQKPEVEAKMKEASRDETNAECDSSLTPTVGASRSRDTSEERDLPKPGSTTEGLAEQPVVVKHNEKPVETIPSLKVDTGDVETNISVVKCKSPVVDAPKESSPAVKLKRRIYIDSENDKPVAEKIPVVQEVTSEVKPCPVEIDTEPEVLELTAEVQLDCDKDVNEPSSEMSNETGSSPVISSQENKPRSRRLNRSSTKDHQTITVSRTESADSDRSTIKSNKAEDEQKTPERRKSSTETKKDVQKPKSEPAKEESDEKVSDAQSKPRRSRVVWEEKPSKPAASEKPIVVVDKKRHRSTEEKIEKPTIVIEKKRLHSSENNEQPSQVAEETVEAVTVSKHYEKVTLKRSRISCPENENNAGAANNLASESDVVVPRKRPWGSRKATSSTKKPVLSISSDSLKTLVPEAKPLPMSEVELNPDEDDIDEGEVDKDDEMSLGDETEQKSIHQHEEVATREHLREVKLIFPTTAPDAQRMTVALPEEPRGRMPGGRKISIISDELRALQRSPSPARHKKSDVLFMTNLVRPFTVNQIKELLARTGTILEDGFWMDTIKSKCYVQYSSEAEAELTRKALHGVRWPASNPKQLCVDYATRADMDKAKDGKAHQGNAKLLRKPDPQKVYEAEQEELEKERIRERERILREMEKLDKDRSRDKDGDRHERSSKRVTSVREWDLGKMDGGQAEDGRQSREDRNKEKERRLRKDRSHRSQSPQDAPARKMKKKEEDAPAKLLDDLFRKTKLTPCIYWLPLTAEQIVVKEEIRRKHMAEHERRMAEMRKVDKERMRERMQGRPSQRRFSDRDKRSPKK